MAIIDNVSNEYLKFNFRYVYNISLFVVKMDNFMI